MSVSLYHYHVAYLNFACVNKLKTRWPLATVLPGYLLNAVVGFYKSLLFLDYQLVNAWDLCSRLSY